MSPFPSTRGSAVAAIRSPDAEERRRAYDVLVAAYWRPAYVHVRARWRQSPEDACDLVQGFFTHALEKGVLEGYQPERARFRTWLRVCLDGYVGHERERASRQKRGGGWNGVPLDVERAEPAVDTYARAVDGGDIDELFRREWVRSVFEGALDDLRALAAERGRENALQIFVRYDVEGAPPGAALRYDDLAAEFGIPVTTVTNQLHAMRRDFRRLVLDRLRALTVDDEEFRAEARALLGRETP